MQNYIENNDGIDPACEMDMSIYRDKQQEMLESQGLISPKAFKRQPKDEARVALDMFISNLVANQHIRANKKIKLSVINIDRGILKEFAGHLIYLDSYSYTGFTWLETARSKEAIAAQLAKSFMSHDSHRYEEILQHTLINTAIDFYLPIMQQLIDQHIQSLDFLQEDEEC